MSISKAVKVLSELRHYETDMWGTYFLGSQITLGSKRVYKTKGAAKARVTDALYYDYNRNKSEAREMTKLLEESGMLEFRILDDLSPRFPYTVPGIDEQQANKLKKMLDSRDEELVDLAINILEGIKNM